MGIKFLSIAHFTVAAAPGGADAESPGLIAWPLLALVIFTLGGLFIIVVLTAAARMRRRTDASRANKGATDGVDPWTESGRRAESPSQRRADRPPPNDETDATS